MTTDPIIADRMQQLGDLLQQTIADNPELWDLSAQLQKISDIRFEPQLQEVRIISTDSTSLSPAE